MISRVEGAGLRFADIEELVRSAVERVATTDPTPGDPFRGLYISDELALTLARGTADDDLDERLEAIVGVLGLDELDARVLSLCLAPELDPRFGRLLAYLHDDVTRRFASPRLVARLLAEGDLSERAVLGRLGCDMPLRRTGALRLLDGDGQTPLAERGLKVDERLASHALGSALEDRLDGRGRLVAVPEFDLGRASGLADLRALLRSDSHIPILVAGPDAVEILAAAIGAPVLVASTSMTPDDGVVDRLVLEATLLGAHLCFELGEDAPTPERAQIVAALGRRRERVLLCAPTRTAAVALQAVEPVVVEVPLPSFDERLALWSARAPACEVEEVAAKFRLSASQIAHAVEVAELVAAAAGRDRADATDLHHGARQASSRRLEELAIRVQPTNGWEDLVLPDRQLESLKSISAHLRYRDLVLSGWGYERTVGEDQGLKVLFFGESGTGKTMAGRVLAHELGLEMYRIDLAAVVSKYIGETEKNLDRIFDAAGGSNAILFFDEADALFGKRSEVSDAHDRYANIEVAYLLQKMEAYAGAVILATNFRGNLDDAFLRRLDFAIEFPFPEPEHRSAIWRAVLPASAPVAADVDVAFLAGRFKLSGGSIRNCGLAAAFLAADDGTSIEMRHLTRAVAAEYVKLGRLTVEADFIPDEKESAHQ